MSKDLCDVDFDRAVKMLQDFLDENPEDFGCFSRVILFGGPYFIHLTREDLEDERRDG